MFVYKLQEEVHRFTVSKMDTAKRKTLKKSSLEKIKGIGPSKAKLLLSHFKTIATLKAASKEELEKVVSSKDAENIIEYFNNN